MMYVKPRNIRYVDMAIWIDAHAYTDDCDEETLYEYIYHLVRMLAYKRKMYQTANQYDGFILYASSRYYLRITDKRQFETNEDGTPVLPKLKSILNYIKKTIYPTKIDYEREFSVTIPVDNLAPVDASFRNYLDDCIDELGLFEFNDCLHNIIGSIRRYLSRIPYRTNTVIWENIYISCLLTFISSVTLNKRAIAKLQTMPQKLSMHPEYIEKLYKDSQDDKPILFHLDANMTGYITVLVNGMRKVIANDLSSILHTHIASASYMKEMFYQSLKKEENDDED